jgi:hypothetical protein
MSNEDDTVWLAFNGEIYNHRELRPLLESKATTIRNASDTETIIIFTKIRRACVQRLARMFAYALWDRHSASLLARDRVVSSRIITCWRRRHTSLRIRDQSLLAGARSSPTQLQRIGRSVRHRHTSAQRPFSRASSDCRPHTLVWSDGEVEINILGFEFYQDAAAAQRRGLRRTV